MSNLGYIIAAYSLTLRGIGGVWGAPLDRLRCCRATIEHVDGRLKEAPYGRR